MKKKAEKNTKKIKEKDIIMNHSHIQGKTKNFKFYKACEGKRKLEIENKIIGDCIRISEPMNQEDLI